jgi:PIN domain nuclease of toxin-antitoxin system
MEDDSHERYVSPAVPWEMAIKLSLGKLRLQLDYDVIFPAVLEANGFQMLSLSMNHFQGLIHLPQHHGDPFDRMMISQAASEGLTVITCDEHFADYGIPTLW